MLYKDACNRKSNQQNLGTIKCSNLCTEIVEYSSPDEVSTNTSSVSQELFEPPFCDCWSGRYSQCCHTSWKSVVFFKVREMSGNYEICQGKNEFWKKSGKTDLCPGKIKFPCVHAKNLPILVGHQVPVLLSPTLNWLKQSSEMGRMDSCPEDGRLFSYEICFHICQGKSLNLSGKSQGISKGPACGNHDSTCYLKHCIRN